MKKLIIKILKTVPVVHDAFITEEVIGKSKLIRVNLIFSDGIKDDFIPDIKPIHEEFDYSGILKHVKYWTSQMKKGAQIHQKDNAPNKVA